MTPDAETLKQLKKAKPLLNRLQDLLWVEKEAVEMTNGPAVLLRFFFTPAGAVGDPSHITFICDPDGAHNHGLLTDDELSKIPFPTKESK